MQIEARQLKLGNRGECHDYIADPIGKPDGKCRTLRGHHRLTFSAPARELIEID